MSGLDEQEEEREVVMSIYDGDSAFHQLTPVTYQYKYGEDGDPKSFLLELTWGEKYPHEPPTVNMDTFYNKHLTDSVKKKIVDYLNQEAENLRGFAMTYSLFEGLKDKVDEFLGEIEETTTQPPQASEEKEEEVSSDSESVSPTKKAAKKEHLTKAQKRKQWDRLDCRGERPRGWDWIDVIHHLSQTGPKVETSSTS